MATLRGYIQRVEEAHSQSVRGTRQVRADRVARGFFMLTSEAGGSLERTEARTTAGPGGHLGD
jgi:hypothetical protein